MKNQKGGKVKMICINRKNKEMDVIIKGKKIKVLDSGDDYAVAECDLDDLNGLSGNDFPEELIMEINSEDGFGTYFFQQVCVMRENGVLQLHFTFCMPNKYWEGYYGLNAYINAIIDAVENEYKNFEVIDLNINDDYKNITLGYALHSKEAVRPAILIAADELKEVLEYAEVLLSQRKPDTQFNSSLVISVH